MTKLGSEKRKMTATRKKQNRKGQKLLKKMLKKVLK